jgi:microcystin-dependent protein
MALRNGRATAAIQTTLTGSVHPPGSGISFWGDVAPTGWVLASGKTVGSATSGATERANADTLDLYTVLWNSYSNSILVIETSGGVPTTRGVSAAADFAANKRMPVLDMRGRAIVGKDNMGGTTASRITAGESGITGTTLGATGGAQTHSLSIAQLANHGHTQSSHSHIDGFAGVNSAATYGVASVGGGNINDQFGNSGANHAWTSTEQPTIFGTGSGSTHQNTQPSIVGNYILKL